MKAAGGEVEEFSKETLLQESFHDTECDILELLNVGGVSYLLVGSRSNFRPQCKDSKDLLY